MTVEPGNLDRKGRFCTDDLLLQTVLDQLIFILKTLITFITNKTRYLNREINCKILG